MFFTSIINTPGQVIGHKDIWLKNEGMRDKFRVQVSEQRTNTMIGKKPHIHNEITRFFLGSKDVSSTLMPTKERSPQPEETFESLPSVFSVHKSQQSIGRSTSSTMTLSLKGVVIQQRLPKCV